MSGTQEQINNPDPKVDPSLKNPPVVDPPEADEDADLADFADPVKAKAEIKKIRAEAAKHRTRAKNLDGEIATMKSTLDKLKTAFGMEDDSVDPAEQLKAIQQQNENYQVELGIVQLARDNGITSDQDDYFRFLLSKRFDSLEEGEELTEEDLQEIVQKSQSISGGKQNPASTGVGSGSKVPAGASKGSVTPEMFAAMSLTEKSKIYTDDSALYSRLLTEAKAKRLL